MASAPRPSRDVTRNSSKSLTRIMDFSRCGSALGSILVTGQASRTASSDAPPRRHRAVRYRNARQSRQRIPAADTGPLLISGSSPRLRACMKCSRSSCWETRVRMMFVTLGLVQTVAAGETTSDRLKSSSSWNRKRHGLPKRRQLIHAVINDGQRAQVFRKIKGHRV